MDILHHVGDPIQCAESPRCDGTGAHKESKLPGHFTPHCLRHTYASVLLQQGESIVYVQRLNPTELARAFR